MYLSNFKWGQDAYLKSSRSDTSGQPARFLQFDAHPNDAGSIPRGEAYLDNSGTSALKV